LVYGFVTTEENSAENN